ncbi:hypothetical protein FB451DRAFT_1561608 [Mycena latifolia]|nr:hypothetical protein FB451DRAFT_1561608 [Mycena latifolia]
MAPRIWFITGASSGFGLIMAKKALENGDKEKRSPLHSAVAKKAFGRIDIVFNNAGVGATGEIEGTPDELARSLFEVNFWGAVNVTKQAVSFFREENKPPGGLLINMSSMYGIDAPPLAGFYGATKFALEAVTDSLAKELDPAWNIKVVLVCPGFFKTEIGTKAIRADVHPAYADNEALASVQVRALSFRVPKSPWFLTVSSKLRKVLSGVLEGNSPLFGDPEKLINKFYELSKLENPPYRVAFGEDALAGFRSKWTALKSAWEVSEEWSKDLKFASS